LAKSPSFVSRTFRNALEYRNADGRVNSGNDLAKSPDNLMNFDSGTQGFEGRRSAPPCRSALQSV